MNLPVPEKDDSAVIVTIKIAIIALTVVMLVMSAVEQTTAVLRKRKTKMGFHP